MENIAEKFTISTNNKPHEPVVEIFTRTDVNDGDYLKDSVQMTYADFKEDLLFQYMLAYVSENGRHVDEDSTFCDPGLFSEFLGLEGLLSRNDVGEYGHSVYIDAMYYYDESNKKHTMTIPSYKDLNVDSVLLDELKGMVRTILEEEEFE